MGIIRTRVGGGVLEGFKGVGRRRRVGDVRAAVGVSGLRAPGWWRGGVGKTDTATAARANTSRGGVDGDGIVRFGGIRRACCLPSARPSTSSPSVRQSVRSFVRSCAARTHFFFSLLTAAERLRLVDCRSRVPCITVGVVLVIVIIILIIVVVRIRVATVTPSYVSGAVKSRCPRKRRPIVVAIIAAGTTEPGSGSGGAGDAGAGLPQQLLTVGRKSRKKRKKKKKKRKK